MTRYIIAIDVPITFQQNNYLYVIDLFLLFKIFQVLWQKKQAPKRCLFMEFASKMKCACTTIENVQAVHIQEKYIRFFKLR